MDIFYRLFYTVFSMSCMIVALTPMVLLLRFLFRRMPRKFTVALWMIFYLRAICPVGMSSPVCLSGRWNRQFHLLLRSIGLKIMPDRGLMTGWLQVYQSQLEASVPYIVCTVLWLVGIAGLFFFTWKRQWDIRRDLDDATHLFDYVYQSDRLNSPVRTGIFRQQIYLPEGLSAKELKNILLHQQLHCKRKDDWVGTVFFVISCVHWWNPCIWLAYYLSGIDREVSCDEAVVRRLGLSARTDYAQDILNMKKGESEEEILYSLVTFREERLSARAEHILYMEKAAVWKEAATAFLLTVCLFCWFMMSAFHTAWNGGQWRKTENVQEDALFVEEEERGITNEVIASCESQTPEGGAVKLELLMTQGTYQRGKGYTGQCILRMKDEEEQTLSSLVLSKIFSKEKVQVFNENISLSVDDYNEDGVMEVSLGQKMEVTDSELSVPVSKGAVTTETASGRKKKTGEKVTVYGYYLMNLETDGLRVISEPVYVSNVTELQEGSIVFSFIEDAEGVITTQLEGETAYYVWDKVDKMYYRRNMTQADIDARREEQKTSNTEGETHVYSLKNDDEQEVVRVAARTDDTGEQYIENVSINPKGVDRLKGVKVYTDIHGYFSKIEWAPMADEDSPQQYAVLTYHGSTGQSFVIYDVEKRKMYYQQRDGNEVLKKVLEGFNETDIAFAEDGMAVYSMMEIQDNNVLKIGFAANTEGDMAVRGSYLHNVSTGRNSDLQFSQEKN